MADTSLSERVRSFICDRIHTIEQLETILLMHDDAEATWTPDDVARRLRIDAALAESALERCVLTRICQVEPGPPRAYTYAPDGASAQAVGELVAAYAHARVEVLMLISTCAMDRIRTAQLHTFAQAFFVRKPSSH